MINEVILFLLLVVLLFLAGLCSGAETGIYQLSRLRLRLGIEKRQLSAVILGRSLRDSSGLLLSTLLGTNLAHYFITSIVTYMLLSRFQAEHTAELAATFITAPTLFVFSEMIPKNIFFYRSDSLMPYCGAILYALHKAFSWCGIIRLLKWISGFFARLTGRHGQSETMMTVVHHRYLHAIVRDTQEEGLLSPVQSGIVDRLVGISHLSVRSVMVPFNSVETVDVNCDRSALLRKLKKCAFTRLLVYDRWQGNVVGFVNLYETLGSGQDFADLWRFVKPVRRLPAQTTVTDAIGIMQQENHKIVLVMRSGYVGRERPIGIVTMKDLVEELVGELTEW